MYKITEFSLRICLKHNFRTFGNFFNFRFFSIFSPHPSLFSQIFAPKPHFPSFFPKCPQLHDPIKYKIRTIFEKLNISLDTEKTDLQYMSKPKKMTVENRVSVTFPTFFLYILTFFFTFSYIFFYILLTFCPNPVLLPTLQIVASN